MSYKISTFVFRARSGVLFQCNHVQTTSSSANLVTFKTINKKNASRCWTLILTAVRYSVYTEQKRGCYNKKFKIQNAKITINILKIDPLFSSW